MTSTVLTRVFFSIGVTFAASLYRFGRFTTTSAPPSTHPHLRDDVSNIEEALLMMEQHTESDFVYPDALYTPEANQDRILDLPGLNYDPGFNQFSGYLTVDPDHGRKIFYWYVESQNDPRNDPVVFWTNGGPGCSGLLGFGTEHGPFYFDRDGTLTANLYSWNQVASILYVEQPAGVGFSYSDAHSDYTTGDAQAASDNLLLIRAFLRRFPERQQNDFFIASESYGGHFIPQLALAILRNQTTNTADDDFINIRLKGFLIGNPYVDPFTNTVTQFGAMYAHGLLPKPLYDRWRNFCTSRKHYNTPECAELAQTLFQELGKGINPYALDYPVCTEKGKHHGQGKATSAQSVHLLHHTVTGEPPFLPSEDEYKPCAEVHFETYLRREDVREALHVNSTAAKWEECTSRLHYSRHDFQESQIDLYRQLVQMGRKGKHKLNMLLYSGDDDSVCSLVGTQEWIYDLGVAPMKKHLWKPWKVEDQTAGFVTHFDLGTHTEATFTFATVHGAGHEVPSFRPMEALQLFKYFLRGEW